MFPCMISKAATVDVISSGEGPNRSGAVQLVSNGFRCQYPSVLCVFVHVPERERECEF